MDELLARLGSPQLRARTVHIAGTKGKGSTAAMIAAALTASGYKTGLYTSPHLHDIKERFRVDNQFISTFELVSLVQAMKPEVAAVNEKTRYGKLTTFELLTALGFAYFNLRKADFQVVEVGLGGRLDATNIVIPEVCVITSIGFDHTEVLGDTLAKIAAEKAGIIKPGVSVVIAPQPAEVADVIEEVCLKNKAPLVRVDGDITYQGLGITERGQSLEVRGRIASYKLTIPLLSYCQLENAATAIAVIEVLVEKGFNIDSQSIVKGLAEVTWPGRFQVIGRQPTIILDGAHNPAAIKELIRSLAVYGGDYSQLILVFGASIEKDVTGMATLLRPYASRVIVTSSRHPRAVAALQLKDEFEHLGLRVETVQTVAAAFKRARKVAGEKDLICVTGSLFVIGEVLEYLNDGSL
jgi:dihydrofolate synthase/folylpolyglutamate synthase